MNINATLFFQLVVFFIGAWVTMKYIWPPLIKSLEERQKKIADGLAAADRGQKSLDEAKRKIAEEQASERAHVQQLVAEAEKRGQAIVEAAKGQAKVEADRIVEAAQILQREVNPQVHSELLAQLKAKL
jgi:F-type H+-transporting ATPase subunit b